MRGLSFTPHAVSREYSIHLKLMQQNGSSSGVSQNLICPAKAINGQKPCDMKVYVLKLANVFYNYESFFFVVCKIISMLSKSAEMGYLNYCVKKKHMALHPVFFKFIFTFLSRLYVS